MMELRMDIDLTAEKLAAKCTVCGWYTEAKPAARPWFLRSLEVHADNFCVPGRWLS